MKRQDIIFEDSLDHVEMFYEIFRLKCHFIDLIFYRMWKTRQIVKTDDLVQNNIEKH